MISWRRNVTCALYNAILTIKAIDIVYINSIVFKLYYYCSSLKYN